MQPQHHFLRHAAGRLHVLEWPSSGPTIVCQHYMWSTADVWTDLFDALGGRFRVLSVDAPGHGESEPLDPEDPAETLLTVLDALVERAAVLVGASNGARRCCFFALRHPERVSRLVLSELPILAKGNARDSERERVSRLPAAPRSFGEIYDAYRKLIYPKADPTLLRSYLQRTLCEVDGVWRGRLGITEIPQLVVDAELTPDVLARLAMPVLVLYAENSRLCGRAGGEILQRAIPGSCLVALPDCGHVVHLNQPDRLHAAIAEFCEPELTALSASSV
jgi:pimeloyl-ACP methyl ester carboxylesterase